MTRHEELKAKGWLKMTVMDEPRLSELREEYLELGFEVHLEPMRVEEETDCMACVAEDPGRYRTIYIRKPPERNLCEE